MLDIEALEQTINEVRASFDDSRIIVLCSNLEGCDDLDPYESCMLCTRLDVFSDSRSSETIAHTTLQADA